MVSSIVGWHIVTDNYSSPSGALQHFLFLRLLQAAQRPGVACEEITTSSLKRDVDYSCRTITFAAVSHVPEIPLMIL
jgi:hypothetical protein